MYLSKYFLPLLKEDPAEATIPSAKLMLRAGLIRKLGSGMYNWLPFGLRVLKKVTEIIHQEMGAIDALEISTPSMQPASLWQKSGRYMDGGDIAAETLIATDRHDQKLIFSPTAEEVFTEIFSENVHSHKQLPLTLYQITSKFRDEIRPRYGIMRAREFMMKDAYSFALNEEENLKIYEKMLQAYLHIFARMDLIAVPVVASTGSIGGNYSHEFHILANTGESTIYYDSEVISAIKKENITLAELDNLYIREEEKHDPLINTTFDSNSKIIINGELIQSKGIEVGHIFHLGEKYSKAMDAKIQNSAGEFIYPSMGCYGIGVSRIVAAIIEVFSDENGIIWPKAVSPFDIIIINLNTKNEKCNLFANTIYETCLKNGIDPLYDDTQDSAGVKFARADLIGIPLRVIISPKNVENDNIEVSTRKEKNPNNIKINYFLENIKYKTIKI